VNPQTSEHLGAFFGSPLFRIKGHDAPGHEVFRCVNIFHGRRGRSSCEEEEAAMEKSGEFHEGWDKGNQLRYGTDQGYRDIHGHCAAIAPLGGSMTVVL
jgi:hypothetical protein